MTDGVTTDAEKVALARQSLAFYIGWAHKTDNPEDEFGGVMVPRPHHLRLINRMEDVARIVLRKPGWQRYGNDRHTSAVAPPGSAKTTILQCFYEWILGKASLEWGDNWADMFHMAHLAHAADKAEEMSYAVRMTIQENPVFKMCFPKVLPEPTKWGVQQWRVKGCFGLHSSFTALGIGGDFLGMRANLIGYDDLIKPEDVKSSKITTTDVEHIIFTLEKVGMKRLVEGGCAWMNHTRWFELDPPAWAENQGWEVLLIQALNVNDESFWPQREIFSAENLMAERDRDPVGFALQFQGLPAAETGEDFKADWLEHEYDELPWNDAVDKFQFFKVVDSWDTAGTKNARSDETAGFTAAIDFRDWSFYILNLYHAKLEMPDLLDAIRGSAMSELHPGVVLIEAKSTGQPAVQLLETEGIRRIHPVGAYGERGQPRLMDVIHQIQPMLRAGQVKWPSADFARRFGLDWVKDAKAALLRYPRGVHDDIARAFIQLLYESLRFRVGEVQWPEDDDDAPQEEIRWAETGGEGVVRV